MSNPDTPTEPTKTREGEILIFDETTKSDGEEGATHDILSAHEAVADKDRLVPHSSRAVPPGIEGTVQIENITGVAGQEPLVETIDINTLRLDDDGDDDGDGDGENGLADPFYRQVDAVLKNFFQSDTVKKEGLAEEGAKCAEMWEKYGKPWWERTAHDILKIVQADKAPGRKAKSILNLAEMGDDFAAQVSVVAKGLSKGNVKKITGLFHAPQRQNQAVGMLRSSMQAVRGLWKRMGQITDLSAREMYMEAVQHDSHVPSGLAEILQSTDMDGFRTSLLRVYEEQGLGADSVGGREQQVVTTDLGSVDGMTENVLALWTDVRALTDISHDQWGDPANAVAVLSDKLGRVRDVCTHYTAGITTKLMQLEDGVGGSVLQEMGPTDRLSDAVADTLASGHREVRETMQKHIVSGLERASTVLLDVVKEVVGDEGDGDDGDEEENEISDEKTEIEKTGEDDEESDVIADGPATLWGKRWERLSLIGADYVRKTEGSNKCLAKGKPSRAHPMVSQSKYPRAAALLCTVLRKIGVVMKNLEGAPDDIREQVEGLLCSEGAVKEEGVMTWYMEGSDGPLAVVMVTPGAVDCNKTDGAEGMQIVTRCGVDGAAAVDLLLVLWCLVWYPSKVSEWSTRVPTEGGGLSDTYAFAYQTFLHFDPLFSISRLGDGWKAGLVKGGTDDMVCDMMARGAVKSETEALAMIGTIYGDWTLGKDT